FCDEHRISGCGEFFKVNRLFPFGQGRVVIVEGSIPVEHPEVLFKPSFIFRYRLPVVLLRAEITFPVPGTRILRFLYFFVRKRMRLFRQVGRQVSLKGERRCTWQVVGGSRLILGSLARGRENADPEKEEK